MDAPDFDELEWMAQQQCLFQEDLEEEEQHQEEDHHHERLIAHLFPPGPENEELLVPASDNCRKRLWSNDTVEEQSKVKKNTVHKRGKVECEMTQLSDLDEAMMSSAMEDPIEEWLPPPPLLSSTEKAQEGITTSEQDLLKLSSNLEIKVPKRRSADIQGDFMSITGPSGERVYAEVKKMQNTSHKLHGFHGDLRRSDNGLLSEPFEVLIEQVEREMLEQACSGTQEEDSLEQVTSSAVAHEQLWVEKYAPKSFTELLSDEQTNREVLSWLKQWDPCVFGEKKTSTSVDVLAALRRQTPVFQGRRFSAGEGVGVKGPVGFKTDNQHASGVGNNDQHLKYPSSFSNPKNPLSGKSAKGEAGMDRPDEKILLLCGPPGLGKTTLAHVAAKHCGYRVVEINASDDRVATTLQSKILDAVQMKSVMGDMRPNCLVIDEIDGALGGADGKSAIDALLKIVYAEKKESFGKENELDGVQVKKGSKKKGASAVRKLSRPVICICNDLFAPALRSLRQMARVHVFAQPSASRVVTRLKYICNLEGYKINARALTALAEHTECDIRSCLNTLQFLKRKKEPLKMLDIASQVVGRKDTTSSAFDIWGEVFQKRKLKPGAAVRSSTKLSENYGHEHKEFLRLHELIANHGDYELTREGVYENLLHIRYHDSSLSKTVECLELLGDSEIISHQAFRNQHFALNGYQPSITMLIRRLIAQPEKPNIEWPRTFQRYRADFGAKKELLRSWMTSMHPAIFCSLTAGCLAWDVVSPLLCILAPQTLRPVAPQLLSRSEREEIIKLVDTMIGYGITYKHTKIGPLFGDKQELSLEPHGLVLEPPINKLVHFKDYKGGHRFLSSTLRQVLSHEVEIETIRRESAARSARATAIAEEIQGMSISETGSERKHECFKGNDSPVLHSVEIEHGHKSAAATQMKHPPLNGSREESTSENCLNLIKSSGMPPNAHQIKAGKPIKLATSFFDQFRKTSQKSGSSEIEIKVDNTLSQRDSRPLLFKFHEGFTNAIRRPVHVRDFL